MDGSGGEAEAAYHFSGRLPHGLDMRSMRSRFPLTI